MNQFTIGRNLSANRPFSHELEKLVTPRSVLDRLRNWARENLLIANDEIWSAARFGIATSIWMPMFDFVRVAVHRNSGSLRSLHRSLKILRRKLAKDTRYHDHGHGYFYQSFERLLISGRRKTLARAQDLGLDKLCRDKKVLDLGSNVCFLALQLTEVASSVDCVDSNPYAIDIGRTVAAHSKSTNIAFHKSDYMVFLRACERSRYDVVLLLSAHISFDHTDPSHICDLLSECRRVLGTNGTLVFESHPRFFEDRYMGLERTFALLSQYFDITNFGQLVYGSMLDRGRLVAFCKPR
jgi:SAM-dependent methyltransferase